jgi:hypothetical protein
LLLLSSGTAIAADCDDPTSQAEIAANARDAGVPQELFTAQMPPLNADSSGPTKQGYAILHDVYALRDFDPLTHKLVRAQICSLGGQATSADDFAAPVKKAILACQSASQDEPRRTACIQKAIPAAAVAN